MTGDIVWTNHLKERLAQRGVSKNEAFETIRHPTHYDKLSPSKYKFYKDYPRKQITVVAVSENRQWIILTAWSRSSQRAQKRSASTYTHTSSEPFISRFVRKGLVKLVNLLKGFFS